MTEDQIEYMVERFLSWRLPKPWNPDNGISYQRPNYAHEPADHDWPTGTNLFDFTQTMQMVRYMLDGIPNMSNDIGSVPERETFWLLENTNGKAWAYYTSNQGSFIHTYTEDVWQAARFKNEREVHDRWRMLDKDERQRWKPVEHMFINKIQDSSSK